MRHYITYSENPSVGQGGELSSAFANLALYLDGERDDNQGSFFARVWMRADLVSIDEIFAAGDGGAVQAFFLIKIN